jgi:hypothetical protein
MAAEPIPPPELRPMSEFDPSQPAVLHDSLTNKIIPWTGEDQDRWRNRAKPHAEGVIAWEGHLIDGWGNVLGG